MKILKTQKSFQVIPWLNNNPCAKLRGEHTKDFTKHTHKICKKIRLLRHNIETDTFCDALYTYKKVHCFMLFVIIDDYKTAYVFLGADLFTQDTYRIVIGLKMLWEFEHLCNQLYSVRMETYLTDRVLGDHETFYTHALRWHFPEIAKRTYSKYGLGVGIFTMERFEAINYMTKQLIRDHTNRKGNICAQTMIRIVMVYMSHNHNVSDSLEIREKLKKKQLETIKCIHSGDYVGINIIQQV